MKASWNLPAAVLIPFVALTAATDIWFAPLDPVPRPGVSYTGPQDFAQLFDPQAPWDKAASRIQIFRVQPRWIMSAGESELRSMITGLADRNIGLALLSDAFESTEACGQGVAGFGDGTSPVEAARRLRTLGGTLRYIALHRPIFAAAIYSGSNACRWTPEEMAANAFARVREFRGEFPDVGIGVIEPVPAVGSADWKSDYAAGIDALQSAFGFALAFFHADADWSRPDAIAAIETASLSLAREYGMPFGVIYSGAANDVSDAAWLANAERRLQSLELGFPLIPDHAVFQSVDAYPMKLLPETDPSSFTGWLNSYFRTRTTITAAVAAPAVAGGLTSDNGEPIANAAVTISAISMEGRGLAKTYRLTGKVTAGTIAILFGIRVNSECGNCRGIANIGVSRFRYSDDRQTSPVERDFIGGMQGWGDFSPASDRNATSLRKGELQIYASPSQQVAFTGPVVPISAGTDFEFTAVARMGPGTLNSGYLCVIFFGPTGSGPREITRARIPFEPPSAVEAGAATTADDGSWSIPLPRLGADRMMLTANFAGSETHWPARSSVVWQDQSLQPAPATAREYTISTLAGGSPSFPVGGIDTFIARPNAVTFDRFGNLYVAGANCVFKMDSLGKVTRVAGNYMAGFSGDGGSALEASLNNPTSVALDPLGNLYIADYFNARVRKVGLDGKISTFAGNGVSTPSGDGGLAVKAGLVPYTLAADSAGNLYVGGYTLVRKITSAGIISMHSPNYNFVTAVVVDSKDNLYVGDGFLHGVTRFAPGTVTPPLRIAGGGTMNPVEGGLATSAIVYPAGLAVDSTGNVFISDMYHRIRKVTPAGILSTIAGNGVAGGSGDGGDALKAQVNAPKGIALDSAGNLFVADTDNMRVRKISRATGLISNHSLLRIAPDSSSSPALISFAESASCNGFEIPLGGNLNSVASTPSGVLFGITQSGALYDMSSTLSPSPPRTWVRRIAGGSPCDGFYGCRFSGDDGPVLDARFCYPEGIASDAHGNLYIADTGNHRIRKVFTDGTIITIAGSGVAGSAGDSGPARQAQLLSPRGIVVDSIGTIYFTDASNRIRVLTPLR